MADSTLRGSGRRARTLRRSLFVMALLAGAFAWMSVEPASASHGNCHGKFIKQYEVKNPSGRVGGYVAIYWNEDKGTNCARLNSASHNWGDEKYMFVRIERCKETRDPGGWADCTPTQLDTDDGNFQYWAGPVSVPARDHCIAWIGIVGRGDNRYTETGAGHCR